MKRLIGLFAAIAIALTTIAGNGSDEKTSFEVDTNASKVYWTAKKVTGEHTGYLNISSGEVYVADNAVVGAEIRMDMNSIEVTDLEGEWKDKLVSHLKSDDFFSAADHPEALFSILSLDDNNVTGELTIKGISHKISFHAQTKVVEEQIKATGKALIDRTKWNIKYGSGRFFSDLGDRMIYDEFEITFELVAKTN